MGSRLGRCRGLVMCQSSNSVQLHFPFPCVSSHVSLVSFPNLTCRTSSSFPRNLHGRTALDLALRGSDAMREALETPIANTQALNTATVRLLMLENGALHCTVRGSTTALCPEHVGQGLFIVKRNVKPSLSSRDLADARFTTTAPNIRGRMG